VKVADTKVIEIFPPTKKNKPYTNDEAPFSIQSYQSDRQPSKPGVNHPNIPVQKPSQSSLVQPLQNTEGKKIRILCTTNFQSAKSVITSF
jgi:hypothetical protein